MLALIRTLAIAAGVALAAAGCGPVSTSLPDASPTGTGGATSHPDGAAERDTRVAVPTDVIPPIDAPIGSDGDGLPDSSAGLDTDTKDVPADVDQARDASLESSSDSGPEDAINERNPDNGDVRLPPVATDGGDGGMPRTDAGSEVDASADAGTPGSIVSMIDVLDVWSGHPVAFALLTRGDQQFLAFYDAQRQMTVAQRTLDSTTWRFARLASTIGWDSHNYIAMGIDSGGFIHVSGNMHTSPLVYFRTTQPLDIGTFQRVTSMIGSNEQSCTYPQFVTGLSGEFVFAYRDGNSGNGNYIFNTYSTTNQTWRRLINTPLMDGQGQRNAYPVGPTLGPDGWWHLVYVWRESSDAATNHDLSYAKSRDLVNWQSGSGRALTLPITLASSDIVDPVPQNGGIINNNTKVGFDSQNRPIVGYHKFDSAGNTQLFNARVEGGQWVSRKASTWNYRWVIGGTGTLIFQIQLDGVTVARNGLLTQVWYHTQLGGWNAFQLDEATLAPVATLGRTLPYPASLERPQSTTPGMGVRWAYDSGGGNDPTTTYMLRWETLAENQDQPRASIPPATRLRLYAFRK